MATIYSNNERYDHQIYNNDQENIKTITTDILSECQDVEIAQVVKKIIDENRFLNSTIDRYKQISLLPFLDQITKPQKFCISHFIETKKPYLIGNPIFPFEDDRIPLPLLITEKYVYIRKIQPIDQGTFKKVDAAMRFPLMINSSKAPRLVAEAASEKQLEQELKERKIHTLFNGCPGIWPIDFYFSSEKAVSSIMKLGDGNFCVLPTLGLSLATKWKIAKDLLLGLDKIHEEGYIHGDLKLNNILYKIAKDALRIGIIDFGFSFKKTESPPSIFKCGFYGSMSETPPELFGNQDHVNMPGFDYCKTDVWALGYILYTIHFKKKPPWNDFLRSFYNEEENRLTLASRTDQVKMNTSVQITIEDPFKNLQKKTKLTSNEKFKFLIYKMMRFNPQHRIDTKAALTFISDVNFP